MGTLYYCRFDGCNAKQQPGSHRRLESQSSRKTSGHNSLPSHPSFQSSSPSPRKSYSRDEQKYLLWQFVPSNSLYSKLNFSSVRSQPDSCITFTIRKLSLHPNNVSGGVEGGPLLVQLLILGDASGAPLWQALWKEPTFFFLLPW